MSGTRILRIKRCAYRLGFPRAEFAGNLLSRSCVFNKNLESLRGVAALMVALCHCLLVLSVDGIDNIWFAHFDELNGVQSAITRCLLVFLNGGAAVTVFFVLSGYVLGLSLDKHGLSLSRVISF